MLKQKLIGLTMVFLSILDLLILGDMTLSILFVPAGVYLAVTKENIYREDSQEYDKSKMSHRKSA